MTSVRTLRLQEIGNVMPPCIAQTARGQFHVGHRRQVGVAVCAKGQSTQSNVAKPVNAILGVPMSSAARATRSTAVTHPTHSWGSRVMWQWMMSPLFHHRHRLCVLHAVVWFLPGACGGLLGRAMDVRAPSTLGIAVRCAKDARKQPH